MASKLTEIRIYQDTAGEYRWSLHATNGRIIADSAEGYGSRWKATRAARGLLKAVAGNLAIIDVV